MQAKRNPNYGNGSISPKGKTWQGRWYVDGKQIKRSLGIRREVDPTGITKKQARKKLGMLMAVYRPPKPGEDVSFSEVAARHIDRKALMGLTERTIYDYRGAVKNHFEPEFGCRAIGSITSAEVERLQQKLLRKLSKRSVKIYMTILNGIFSYAVKHGMREDNPCMGVERPKIPHETEIRVLYSAELAAVLDEIPDDDLGEIDRVLYPLSAKSGLRQAESTKRLMWRHLDFEGRTIRVLGKTKSGRGRTVPMASDLKKMLLEWRQETPWDKEDDLVFANPATGKPIDSATILRRFQRAVRRANVGEFEPRMREGRQQMWPLTTFHDLRHSFATTCAMAGVPLRTLMAWMGHADIQTTMIYAHYYPTEHEADVLDRALGVSGAGLVQGLDLQTATHE